MAFACLLFASTAVADVTGSFDGTVTPKKTTDSIPASAVFSQGLSLTGTIALPGDLEAFGGEYLVTGKASTKRLKVTGTGTNGAFLKYRAKISGDTLRGKLKVRGPVSKLNGTLELARNEKIGDGASCDPVYTANQTLFTTQVLGQALANCDTCHQPGLQASATRLHVLPADPLSTARDIALLVDSANPTASRILQKPLNVLPHGGGVQLTAGSPEEQALAQWAGLIAAAGCN